MFGFIHKVTGRFMVNKFSHKSSCQVPHSCVTITFSQPLLMMPSSIRPTRGLVECLNSSNDIASLITRQGSAKARWRLNSTSLPINVLFNRTGRTESMLRSSHAASRKSRTSLIPLVSVSSLNFQCVCLYYAVFLGRLLQVLASALLVSC